VTAGACAPPTSRQPPHRRNRSDGCDGTARRRITQGPVRGISPGQRRVP
jgi:hypothetical protein